MVSEDWHVWMEVLPSLGIEHIVAWEKGHSFMKKFFAGTVPGLSVTSS